jgi:hypothetical protein
VKKRAEYAQTFRVPANLWEKLVQSAKANLRSTNRELVWILREHFRGQLTPEGLPAEDLNGTADSFTEVQSESRMSDQD